MDQLRVEYLAGYGLQVPDVTLAEAFYTAFGLQADTTPAALQMRTKALGPAELVIVKGPKKRLHHLSFAIRQRDMAPCSWPNLSFYSPVSTVTCGKSWNAISVPTSSDTCSCSRMITTNLKRST